MHKIRSFFREYSQFGFILVTVLCSLTLDIMGRDKVAHVFLATASLASALPLAKGMVDDLRDGKYGIDILALTAIISGVLLHEYWAAVIIVLMLTGGEALEDYAENRAKKELTALMDNAPKKAHLLKNGKESDVTVAKINIGDMLLVKTGEIVPVDGIITEGRSSFDESSLTGESLPIDKKPGDTVMSGSVNQQSAITIKATATAKDSQYEQIIKLVQNAASTESPFVRLTDRYAVPFTLLSFAIAGGVWAYSGDANRFLQVIVVATPCPLLLAAPIALISGMSRSAKHGIIIKNGSSLEKLANVKTIGFDKTGTLTYGAPKVENITVFKPFKKDEVLQIAASVEKNSSHILAKSVVEYAERKKLQTLKTAKVHEELGMGLTASVKGRSVLIGKKDFLVSSGIDISGSANNTLANTASYISIDGQLAGVITFTDEIRKETKNMLAALKKLGIKHTLMVSGDNRKVANTVAKKLGISQVIAEALPGDKVRAVEEVKDKPIAFVGDGVNDAPVLTASDVGIALGAKGSTAASQSADVVIMLDDINKVAEGVSIAKRTFSIARQAILIGIGMSIILQIIFATGRFKAVYGAFLQEVVDVVVILIALRAHGSFKKKTTIE